MIRTLPILILGAALAACAPDVTAPRSDLGDLPEGLDVQFTVEPGQVRQHGPFSVHFSVSNTTTRTIQVVTAHGCLVTPHVIRNGESIPFKGSWWGCTAAITTHTFAPGESRSHTWDMRAELYAQHPGDVAGVPAPKGAYIVRAVFDTYSENGPYQKPLIERTLRVQ